MVDLQTSSLIQIARVLDLELMLIPRNLVLVVKAMQNPSSPLKSIPAYRLSEEEEEDDNEQVVYGENIQKDPVLKFSLIGVQLKFPAVEK